MKPHENRDRDEAQKRRMRKRARRTLARMRPMDDWIGDLSPELHATISRVAGSPEHFYTMILDSLVAESKDPAPNAVELQADGSTKFRWE